MLQLLRLQTCNDQFLVVVVKGAMLILMVHMMLLVVVSTICIVVDLFKYLTTTLTIGFAFVITFSPWLNVCPFIRVYNFGVICKNKFERGD